jgi:protein phosphatase
MSLFDRFRSKPEPAQIASTTRVAAVVRPGLVVDADILTDVGCVRDHNEDCIGILHEHNESLGDRALLLVADGMGGHNAGEVASAACARMVEAAFPEMRTRPAESLKNSLEQANAAIHKQSVTESATSGMGTTCTALLLQDGYGYSAHVGDSRLYLIRNQGIYQMSEDHSAVMELVNAGEITMQQARHHPDKNVITRSLGGREHVEVSTWPQPLPLLPGDRFLLCSDGMYDQIEDEEIYAIVSNESPTGACRRLVDCARERGGGDNISVAIVALKPIGDAAKPSERGERQTEESSR